MQYRLWILAFVAGGVASFAQGSGVPQGRRVPPLWEHPTETQVRPFDVPARYAAFEPALISATAASDEPNSNKASAATRHLMVSSRDGSPIDKATILVVQDTPAARDFGLSLPRDIFAEGRTGTDGRALLSVADQASRAIRALVSAPGFVPQSVVLSPDAEESRIVLDKGATLSGEVHVNGPAGGEVDVQAIPVELPFYTAQADLLSRRHYRVRLGADRRYTIHGLAPGFYRLHAYGDGWAQRASDRAPRCPVAHQLIQIVGDTTADLTIDAVRCFRLALWSKVTDQPLSAGLFPITVVETAGVEWSYLRDPLDLNAGPTWIRAGAHVTATPWIYCGYVRLKPGQPAAEGRVAISTGGIQYGMANVRLFLPSTLATSTRADQISLSPLDQQALGELTIPADTNSPDESPVFLALEGPAVRVQRFALGSRRTSWTFRELPIGEYSATLVRGSDRTAPFKVTIPRESAISVDPAWITQSGVRLLQTAPTGRRLWDATVGLVPVEKRDDGLTVVGPPFTYWSSPLDLAGVLKEPPIVPVPSGRFRAWVLMPGYEDRLIDVDVPAASAVPVVATLQPKKTERTDR